MGLRMAWVQLAYFLLTFDSTSGIRCQSCTSVKSVADCHNVITCPPDNVCQVYASRGMGLGCAPRAICPLHMIGSSGIGGSYFSACCDDGDSCVLNMPDLNPPKVTHLDPPQITGSTLLKLHSTSFLTCSGGNRYVVLNYAWLFNGGSTLPPHAVVHNEIHHNYVAISEMTRSEVGTYTCIISKDGFTANSSVAISVIEANSPIGVVTIDANRPITNGKMILVLHDKAYIECHSQRNDVTFGWQFNGNSTLPRTVKVDGSSLRFEFMEEATQGSYTCIVSTNGLATSASVWVSVKEEKARVTQVTSFPTHPEANHLLNIECHVKGFPQPTIIWSFRDPMGHNYMPPGASNPTPDTVHIDSFQSSLHSGTWTCMARNSVGVDQMSINI